MPEMNDVTVMTSSRAGVVTSRSVRSYSSAKDMIDYFVTSAEKYSDVTPVVTWSSFKNRTGHLVERCSIVWWIGAYRFVDTVWIKRGYRWYR